MSAKPAFTMGIGAVVFVLAMNATRADGAADPAGAGSAVSGVLVPEAGEGEASPARSLLLLPRLAVATAAFPVRHGLIAYERHNVKERVIDIFFDDTRTFGVYPSVTLESRTTIGVGVRVVHRNLLGTGIRFKGAADGGGEYQQRLDGSLGSPALFGAPLWLHLRGGWQRQPRAPFYGIGDQPDPSMLVDGEVHARHFRQEIARAQLSMQADPAGPLFGNVDFSFVTRSFGQDPRTVEVDQAGAMELTTLPGWSRGTDVLYLEGQIGVDTLKVAHQFLSASAPSTGTRVLAFGGPAWGVDGDPTSYLRYGLEARRYFDLHAGDRVLMLRAYAEGVTTVSDEAEVPFTDLPRLGGPHQLRGFTRDRFRDRLAVLGTAEYRYPIWRELNGFLFVDAGRVLSGADQLDALYRDPGRVRIGGGGGLEMYQGSRFRLRGQVAGSEDGLFFQLSFEPAYRVTSSSYRI